MANWNPIWTVHSVADGRTEEERLRDAQAAVDHFAGVRTRRSRAIPFSEFVPKDLRCTCGEDAWAPCSWCDWNTKPANRKYRSVVARTIHG